MLHSIVIATHNQGKIKDFISLAEGLPIHFISQADFKMPDADETGSTFVENALIKARHASQFTDYPVMADDSGLLIDGLSGAPGLYSARYAGTHATDEENIDRVLKELNLHPNASRKARFYIALVLLRHKADPMPIIKEGIWEGEILLERQGTAGFGYLPIFYCKHFKKGAAELSSAEKCRISHRSKAFRLLIEQYLQNA